MNTNLRYIIAKIFSNFKDNNNPTWTHSMLTKDLLVEILMMDLTPYQLVVFNVAVDLVSQLEKGARSKSISICVTQLVQQHSLFLHTQPVQSFIQLAALQQHSLDKCVFSVITSNMPPASNRCCPTQWKNELDKEEELITILNKNKICLQDGQQDIQKVDNVLTAYCVTVKGLRGVK